MSDIRQNEISKPRCKIYCVSDFFQHGTVIQKRAWFLFACVRSHTLFHMVLLSAMLSFLKFYLGHFCLWLESWIETVEPAATATRPADSVVYGCTLKLLPDTPPASFLYHNTATSSHASRIHCCMKHLFQKAEETFHPHHHVCILSWLANCWLRSSHHCSRRDTQKCPTHGKMKRT